MWTLGALCIIAVAVNGDVLKDVFEEFTHITCERNGRMPNFSDMWIGCFDGRVISVISANYGRTAPSSRVCPYAGSHRDKSDCVGENSLAKVRARCHGKTTCTVPPTNGFFGDTCPGTYKYLEVKYKCSHPVQTKITCERNGIISRVPDMKISCPDAYVIQINYANYGRTASSRQVCSYVRNHRDRSDCVSANSFAIVSARCDGTTSCTIPPTNGLFGDTCGGTYKYLEVKYTCTNPVQTKITCERNRLAGRVPDMKISCPNAYVIQINYANYGRAVPSSQACPFFRNHGDRTGCGSPNSLVKVRARCHGRRSCTIPPTNGYFGDPCPGTYKYLEVNYDCVNRPLRLE